MLEIDLHLHEGGAERGDARLVIALGQPECGAGFRHVN
jgi:hypothetical protein